MRIPPPKKSIHNILLLTCIAFAVIACDDGFTQSDIDNAVNEATESLNEEIAELESELELAETQIATLEAEKATLEKEKSKILSDIEKIETEITTLKSKKAALESDVNANQEEIEKLNSAISTLENEKEVLIAQANELNSNILEKENEIEKLETENTGLKYCIKGEHELGKAATCVSPAICARCGGLFGELNVENHDITTIDSNGICECGIVFVAKVDNRFFASFTDALAAWTNNTTLTLFQDMTDLTETVTTTAKGLILDLNGHTLASTADWTLKVDGASELTIRDSKNGGQIKGTVIVSWNSGSGNGTILLESGTLEEVGVSGIFTMTGGSIRNENGVALQVNNDTDTVLITGGEIYGSDYGVWITSGNVIISDTVKITGATQYAIFSYSFSEVVISGTPTISGTKGEFYLLEKITLNTQPADGEVWRVYIDTGVNTGIKDGIFAIPGEGVSLNASKFASTMDGYEVKQNSKGELFLCNHTEQTAISNGNGTHNTSCLCGKTIYQTNLACSGGLATDTHKAYCEYCNAPYGELNPDVHYDIHAINMTAEELETALLELLNSGKTDIFIILAANADDEMFTAINTALHSSTAAEGSVNLSIAGVQVVPKRALGNGHPEPELNTDPIVLKTLNLPDAVTLEMNAISAPKLETIYAPKVTEWNIWGIWNANNISTLVLTAQNPITANFTELNTYDIDLTLNKDKEGEVTNGNQWMGETWKSITFAE